MEQRMAQSLDRWITGNWGEDQFRHERHRSSAPKPNKVKLYCNFCRKSFQRSPRILEQSEIKCPNCGEYDVEVY